MTSRRMGAGVQQGDWAGRALPEINQELCVLCGDCVPSCPSGALAMGADRIVLDEARCTYCGDCEDICPVGAIALPYQVVLRSRSAAAPPDEEERHG